MDGRPDGGYNNIPAFSSKSAGITNHLKVSSAAVVIGALTFKTAKKTCI